MNVKQQAEPQKPSWRGVLHKYAFWSSIPLFFLLVYLSNSKTIGVAIIYGLSLSGLLGTSALYHRINWTPKWRWLMRRLDHTMIFVLIAGTFTPFAVLFLQGGMKTFLLSALWLSVVLGIVMNLLWHNSPKWIRSLTYVVVGWLGMIAFPDLLDEAGWVCMGLIAFGGVLYTIGALAYAAKRPNPIPTVFGYHEVFHSFVILGALAHYVSIAGYVIPST